MSNEYYLATRRDMTIRIVPTRDFITRIVDERAATSFERDLIILVEDVYDSRRTIWCALACMVILASLAGVLTFGLASFLYLV